jgi:hypothetical protein
MGKISGSTITLKDAAIKGYKAAKSILSKYEDEHIEETAKCFDELAEIFNSDDFDSKHAAKLIKEIEGNIKEIQSFISTYDEINIIHEQCEIIKKVL